MRPRIFQKNILSHKIYYHNMPWKKLERSNASAWMFEEVGDLEGVYLASHNAKSKKGKPIVFHEFKIENGEIVSVLGGVVLDRNFSDMEKGTKVKIEFKGEKEGKNGNFKDYEVSVWENEQ